jgi:hypothetical protein
LARVIPERVRFQPLALPDPFEQGFFIFLRNKMNPNETESKAEVIRRAIMVVFEHVADAIADELMELPSPELIVEEDGDKETEN